MWWAQSYVIGEQLNDHLKNLWNTGVILLGSYYMYCSDFWWILLFIFITALPFLLQVYIKAFKTI